MSKAEEKRAKELRNSLLSLLNSKLVNFKEEYLTDSVKWNFRQLENGLNKAKKVYEESKTPNNAYYVKMREDRLKLKTTLTLGFINEANEGYNLKIEKLIKKLIESKIETRFLKIEEVYNQVGAFEFLISDSKIEVHARVIFANGEINAPHFRFITTKRNK